MHLFVFSLLMIKQYVMCFAGPGGLRGKLLNDTIFTGKDHPGLRAFFGTVECQGRGSLHLHMLVWLAGFPSPAELMRRINEFLKTFPTYNHDHPETQRNAAQTVDAEVNNYVPADQNPIGNASSDVPTMPHPMQDNIGSNLPSDILP